MKINNDICKDNGIFNSDLIKLQHFNVIIGKNGAGKTRLLNAIRTCCLYEKCNVVYGYFPDINSSISPNDDSSKAADRPLYEMIFENHDIQVDDFIRYIERQGYKFLCELLRDLSEYSNYAICARRDRCGDFRDKLNPILESLIDRRLIFDHEIMVESTTGSGIKVLKEDLQQMSPGELVLFYLSILLVFFKYKNEKIVVLLDEPELHLHPKALLKFMDYLKNEPLIDTCCIATHSVFMIPSADFFELIYIENSKIQKHNSNLYNNLYESVVGANEELCDFFISRDNWQYYNFIAECFQAPTLVSKVDKNDQQFVLFSRYINQIKKIRGTVTILDYGAGSGRLGKMIEGESGIQYFYYDKYEKNPPKSLKCIKYNDMREITVQNKKFHCVVLMNVLHEIDVHDWKHTFFDIYNILEEGGYLLIFEVFALLHGEQPYGKTGYLLLGEDEMKKLFKDNASKMIKTEYSEKTHMCVIKRNQLKNVCEESIIDALQTLEKNLYTELKKKYMDRREKVHKKEEVDRQFIKNYGFLSQHYLNAKFALESMRQQTDSEATSGYDRRKSKTNTRTKSDVTTKVYNNSIE